MSGPPQMRSLNCAESDSRPVLGPAGNKARTMDSSTKQLSKPQRKVEKPHEIDESKSKKPQSLPSLNSNPSPPQPLAAAARCFTLPSSLSLNASSCSSDASSSDSPQSRASSTGRRMSGRSVTPIRRKQCGPKRGAVEKVVTEANGGSAAAAEASVDSLPAKKRCAWVTTNTDPCYAAFHDEEWGVPVHDDKKLFELLIFSTALAELSWPAILSKRHMFREVFLEFDPIAVSKLNEKKIGTPGTPASSLLSEMKLRAIFENARQMCKITDEFGSFDNYVWGFVNHKPTVSQFRYPRQVPIKTSKADMISKDLVRRGFRGVGPTVVYSFMQVAGMTNDHLISCFRFHECIAAADAGSKDGNLNGIVEEKQHEDSTGLGLARGIDDLSLLATE